MLMPPIGLAMTAGPFVDRSRRMAKYSSLARLNFSQRKTLSQGLPSAPDYMVIKF